MLEHLIKSFLDPIWCGASHMVLLWGGGGGGGGVVVGGGGTFEISGLETQ